MPGKNPSLIAASPTSEHKTYDVIKNAAPINSSPILFYLFFVNPT